MNNSTSNNDAAATILEQLGGIARLSAMAGARDFLAGTDTVQFKVGRNARGVTAVRVVLETNDTYTVTLYRIRRRGLDVTIVKQYVGVYADNLREVVEQGTGLYLSL